MTLLETVAAFTAPLATWAALVSMIRCKRAVSDARKALIVAERALNETANLNAPLVLFQCEMRQQNIYAEVLVTIFNSGNQPTDITSGRITLMQGNYANVERARELQAISLPGRREHFEEFRILKGMETGEAQHDNV